MAPYQVFTCQNYPYLQKHSGVLWTEIATLKRAFFVEPLWGVAGGVNPLGGHAFQNTLLPYCVITQAL